MSNFLNEFKEFAMRGNVVDLAIGVVIGGAFGKITTSFVNDIIMPPLGLLISGMDFSKMAFTLKAATETSGAVVIAYGAFLQVLLNFIIIALVIFMLVKGINQLKRREEESKVKDAPPAPPREEQLLEEILSVLKTK